MMPELPEVEMYRRDLEGFFINSSIESIRIFRKDIWISKPDLPSEKVFGESLFRQGKILVFSFRPSVLPKNDGQVFPWFLLSRFGMSGSWRILDPKGKNPSHTHLEIRFSRTPGRLVWVDPRRFGRLEWVPSLSQSSLLSGVGPDALSITPEDLFKAFKSSSRTVRSILMDQSQIAGIGNIYAAEILFRAMMNPFRNAAEVSIGEIDRLCRTMKTVLEESLRAGGSTIHSYARQDGSQGAYQHQHRVYGRGGQPCVQCGIPVQKVLLEGRSLYYCSFCQGSMESTRRRHAAVEFLNS
jgi:formamidopyrimidine-DNA glycosylase